MVSSTQLRRHNEAGRNETVAEQKQQQRSVAVLPKNTLLYNTLQATYHGSFRKVLEKRSSNVMQQREVKLGVPTAQTRILFKNGVTSATTTTSVSLLWN